MKVVVAYGGLGNVMFQYALVCAFRARGVKSFLFVAEPNVEHHGYELEKVFPKTDHYRSLNTFQKMYYGMMEKVRKIGRKRRHFPHRAIFFPFPGYHYSYDATAFHSQVFDDLGKSCYLIGHFQSYKFFQPCRDLILSEYQFDTGKLSEKTREMASRIQAENSVSIHVRRGDYMNEFYYNMLGAVCNLDYYRRAIERIRQLVANPHFFIFSDDKEYVAENLKMENATFVDFNSGSDSWQDMYLMSLCNNNIIANSSFSWWAAWLNDNPSKIVIAPSRWFVHVGHDELVPEDWIRL